MRRLTQCGETAARVQIYSREHPFVIPSAVEESLTSWQKNSKRCLDFRSTWQAGRSSALSQRQNLGRKTTLRAIVVQTPYNSPQP